MEKCYACEKGNLKYKKIPYKLYGELIGYFGAEVCDSCDEVFFDEETSKKIITFLKLKKGEEVTIYPESKNRLIVEM